MTDRVKPGATYARLRAGSCEFAVPVESVLGALALPAEGLTPLPRRQGAIEGVVQVEGSALPVVALERWVPVGEPGDPAEARIVILASGGRRVGLRVDALNGTQWIAADAVRQACHDGDADELFCAVVPASAGHPLLCLLEVDRLMALTSTWCGDAGVPMAGAPAAAGRAGRSRGADHALFAVGDALYALAAASVFRLEKTPPLELRWEGRRVCGIGSWNGRKIPLVDLAPEGPGDPGRPWMAVLVDGPLALGLVVSRFERMLRVAEHEIVPDTASDVLLGRAHIADVGVVSIIDREALFRAVPESTISRTRSDVGGTAPATTRVATAGTAGSPGSPGSAHDSHYLVFEADRSYASPAAGLLGVAALPPAAIDELACGRHSSLDWRGQKLGVVSLPPLDGQTPMGEPRIAVVLAGQDGRQARSAIAVRSLTRWLPARVARRSSMRLHGVGEVDVITPPGGQRGTSLVVVDLAQMAYLLG